MLDKDSPLTACVSAAVERLRAGGHARRAGGAVARVGGQRPGTAVIAWTLSPLAQERLAYRRSRARRSTLVALASTVVFAVAVGFGVTSSPGWPRVQETFFDPAVGWESLPAVLAGCGSTSGCWWSPSSGSSCSGC